MIILDSTKSDILRDDYIKSFVNTASSLYKGTIEQKTMFSDGLCYTGYLWDSLLSPKVILEQKADQLLQDKQNIYIMWDIHSCERIFVPNYWKFPKEAVLLANSWVEVCKNDLPEDVYIFDDTFLWSVIYTHETDMMEKRYCLFVDKAFRKLTDKI